LTKKSMTPQIEDIQVHLNHTKKKPSKKGRDDGLTQKSKDNGHLLLLQSGPAI